MAEKVKIKIDGKPVRIVREKGYLYYVKGDPLAIYKVKAQHKGRTKGKGRSILVKKTDVARNKKYLYYISSDSCLSRTKRKGA